MIKVPPSGLTTIAARNGGEFPRARADLNSFRRRGAGAEDLGRLRIDNLARYPRDIQANVVARVSEWKLMGHQLLLKLVLQENRKMPLTLRETKLPQELPCGVTQANVFRKLGSLAWKGSQFQPLVRARR